jgi:hypothetical protein
VDVSPELAGRPGGLGLRPIMPGRRGLQSVTRLTRLLSACGQPVGVAALRLLSTCFSYDDVASMTEKYQHEPVSGVKRATLRVR